MADVFISYSQKRIELTRSLARSLEQAGYTVWWDASLLPADSFRREIARQIDESSAAIIVWTPQSAQSTWVAAEASRAAAQHKLISVKSNDLEVHQIPLPFSETHTVAVENRAAIIKSVKLLVERQATAAEPNAADHTSTGRIARPTDLNEISLWQEVYPYTVTILSALVNLAILAVANFIWPGHAPRWASIGPALPVSMAAGVLIGWRQVPRPSPAFLAILGLVAAFLFGIIGSSALLILEITKPAQVDQGAIWDGVAFIVISVLSFTAGGLLGDRMRRSS